VFLVGLVTLPTVAFWGSSPSKEGLFFLGFGIFIYAISRICSRNYNWKTLLLFSVSVIVLLLNKPHAGLIIVPLSIIPIVGSIYGFNKRILLLFVSVLIGGISILCFTPDRINILNRVSYKQRDLINMGEGGVFFITDSSFCAFKHEELDHFLYDSDSNLIQVKDQTNGEYKLFGQDEFHPFTIQASDEKFDVYHIIEPANTYIEVPRIDYSGMQLIKNIPLAMFNVIVRPLPNDPGDKLQIILFFENILFITWLFFSFVRRKKLNEKEKSWVFYLISSALLLTLIIGLTTPILGAIVRYKMVPILLLYICSFILFTRKRTTT
jgi:hypothetical protein